MVHLSNVLLQKASSLEVAATVTVEAKGFVVLSVSPNGIYKAQELRDEDCSDTVVSGTDAETAHLSRTACKRRSYTIRSSSEEQPVKKIQTPKPETGNEDDGLQSCSRPIALIDRRITEVLELQSHVIKQLETMNAELQELWRERYLAEIRRKYGGAQK
ncbi:hypothetical protein B7463_g6026, partial [Scytalidium lignicola]